MNTIDDQLLSPAYIESPYATFDQMRSQDSFYWSEKWSAWLITRYEDARSVLNDYTNFSNRGRYTLYLSQLPAGHRRQLQPLINHYEQGGLVQSDPPEHTRLRRLVNMAFTPRVVAVMRDMVIEIVDTLLDEIEPAGEVELIKALAFPLPAIVIAGMLGVAKDERDQFKEWSSSIQRFLGAGKPELELALDAQNSWQNMNATFKALVDERRIQPRDDLVTALVQACDNEERLSEDELIKTCGAMLIAGHETTTNLISSGILALLRHPDQLTRLKGDDSLYTSAIEEFLRYDSPFQSVPRTVTQDMQIGRSQVKKGQLVYVMLGAANRDPQQFPQPDQLDIGRHPNKHIAFGHGIHFCLGAALSRLEGPIAIKRILERLPNLQIAPENPPVWKKTMVQRGLKSLTLQF